MNAQTSIVAGSQQYIARREVGDIIGRTDMAFWGFMTVREHEAVVAEKNGDIDRLASQLRDGDREISQLKADVTAAEMAYEESRKSHQRVAAELATLKAERDILDEACNKSAIELNKAATELAHWKKHGQLRDPATGRLIPKAKPSDTFTASHSPKAQAARGGDVREGV